MADATTFADILPVKQTSSHTYAFTFRDEWCTGTVPSGGYVASAFLIAARTHMQQTHPSRNQPDVINCHLEYLRRTSIGPATIIVRDIKLGSRISNLHLVLSQGTDALASESKLQDEVHAYTTMSSLANEQGTTHDTEYKLSPPQLPADLVALATNVDKDYVLRRPDAFATYRRAAGNVKMYFVRPDVRGTHYPPSLVDMWACLAPRGKEETGRWTNDALGFLVDIFPGVHERYVNAEVEDALLRESTTAAELAQLVEQSKLGGNVARFWYPTLVLNLDVKKKLPEPAEDKDGGSAMLFVRIQAKKILHGRMDLSVEVWDEGGDLVALSSHASLIMDAARNATRRNLQNESKI